MPRILRTGSAVTVIAPVPADANDLVHDRPHENTKGTAAERGLMPEWKVNHVVRIPQFWGGNVYDF